MCLTIIHLHISIWTLSSSWDSKGLIPTTRTPTGISLYDVEFIAPTVKFTRGKAKNSGRRVIYARVSSTKQKADLERQIQLLSEKFPGHKVIRDIGSGINWSRPGLKTLLRYCLDGSIREVVVAHRDRLSRLGFELLKFLIEEAGGKLVVLSESQTEQGVDEFRPESELGEDLLSIVHIFSCRHYGRRKYGKGRRKSTETQETNQEGSKDEGQGGGSEMQEGKDTSE
ncbi:putative integrase/resolvase [Feldmannia species virus]|uniref:Putative integrase/resolvase n=1 Tax=Feldmannia species virus TaxID=39420 RepID=B5LW92_9PHYC|nr:transposase [Feldmannia species virus]ACH46755.1 putative integrase/resolvase [Feldmannia species virus]